MAKCTNGECENYENNLTENDISETENVDSIYKDLVNCEEYSDADDVPGTHSYDEYNLIQNYYTCPICQEDSEDIDEPEIVFVRTVKRSDA